MATAEDAVRLDREDALASFRSEFSIPRNTTYLVGHSLGLMSSSAREALEEVSRQWQTLAVESWFDPAPESPVGPWLDLEARVRPLLAPWLGAQAEDLTVMNALGTNLQAILHTLYAPSGRKRKITMMRSLFPQDRWLVANHLRLAGFDSNAIDWVEPRPGERLFRTEDIVSHLERGKDDISVLLIESVGYVTGQAYDVKSITQAAHRAGVRVILDVAHGAFVLPLKLNEWDVDGAIGCTYKFGCSGPGGIGLFYLNRRFWSDASTWRPGGWWGNDRATQFAMGPAWQAASGAAAWQVSTLPVLACAPFLGSLEVFQRAGVEAVTAKARTLTAYAYDLLTDLSRETKDVFAVISPSIANERGAELALEFREREFGKRVKETLRQRGVLVDYRESPFDTSRGIVRAGFHPLFNSYADVAQLVEAIRSIFNSSDR